MYGGSGNSEWQKDAESGLLSYSHCGRFTTCTMYPRGQKRQEEASKRELLFQFAADDVTGFTRQSVSRNGACREARWALVSHRNRWRCAAMTRNTVN